MYHLVYLIKNLKNNKIYVGKHSTYNPEDSYFSSSVIVHNAIKRYGKQNFKKTILYYCLTEKDAYDIEASIVNESFVKRNDTYNIQLGGYGTSSLTYLEMYGPQKAKEMRALISKRMKGHKLNLGRKQSEIQKKNSSISRTGIGNTFFGKSHSEETKQKIRQNHPNSKKYKLISPKGEFFNFEYVSLRDIAKRHNLSFDTLYKAIGKGKIILNNFQIASKSGTVLNCRGWTINQI